MLYTHLVVYLSSLFLACLVTKMLWGTHVESLDKVKVNYIYCSPLIHQTSNCIVGSDYGHLVPVPRSDFHNDLLHILVDRGVLYVWFVLGYLQLYLSQLWDSPSSSQMCSGRDPGGLTADLIRKDWGKGDGTLAFPICFYCLVLHPLGSCPRFSSSFCCQCRLQKSLWLLLPLAVSNPAQLWLSWFHPCESEHCLCFSPE